MRRKRLSKIAAVSLAFALCVGTLSGCGKKGSDDSESSKGDLYSAIENAKDLEAGEFEMTIGLEVPNEDEKMEVVLSGVTTDESFDIEVSLNMEMEELNAKGAVTQLVYDDEHLYVNLGKAMEYINSVEEIGDLSDYGIDGEYVDIYVGDLYEQTDNSAAGELGDLLLEVLEDAATSTDKKEGAATDGSIEFKDDQVIAFFGNVAQSVKDNADDLVDLLAEASSVSYDYDKIFDYYGDLFEEYGIDVEEYKEQLESADDMEITDEQKENMVKEIETSCDEIISSCEEDEDADVKGSKFLMEASLDGKKGSRTYELNLDFLASSEENGEETRIYVNYVFEEGEVEVKVPQDSIDVAGILVALEPFMAGDTGLVDPGMGDDPATGESELILNEDGSYGLGCYWGTCDYTGRVDFVTPEGYTVDETYSDIDIMMYDDAEGNFLCVSVYDGNDYINSYDYTNTIEKGEVPKGTISTPLGDMEYIIDNTENYYSIYGFVIIDPDHYLQIDYTNYFEPTQEGMLDELNKIVQGLKPVQ